MGTQNKRFGAFGNLTYIEAQRKQLQITIDGNKSIDERRKLGQFATPFDLAKELVSYGLELQKSSSISFLEPSIGTGAFYSALLFELQKSKKRLDKAIGIELDTTFYNAAKSIWSDNITLYNQDFTSAPCIENVNLLISNPPYVRHHYINQEQKTRLNRIIQNETGIQLSGLAGLYCYFILLAHKWLAPNAISGWLIPSEFMDVNYGVAIKKYLLDNVHLLRIHRYDPTDSMFDDALISSCVVWFSNEVCAEDYSVEFTYGGTLNNPQIRKNIKKSTLKYNSKWTRLLVEDSAPVANTEYTVGDFFTVKRGMATGDNDFFILDKVQIDKLGMDMTFFTPILPSPRHLKVNEIFSDKNGNPTLSQPKYLLNCTLSETELKKSHPKLWLYLQSGKDTTGNKYLCRSRKIWYMQEHREPTPFLCSYMGRSSEQGSPFRFILNHSNAIATNSYLMLYPKKDLAKAILENPQIVNEIWKALKLITATDLENEGRVYGGGLKKIEPKELSKVKFNQIADLIALH